MNGGPSSSANNSSHQKHPIHQNKYKTNNIEVLMSTFYTFSNTKLDINDIDIITKSTDWIIVAGDLNTKHTLWNSQTPNYAGNLLYQHVQQKDYVVLAPDSRNAFLYISQLQTKCSGYCIGQDFTIHPNNQSQ